MANRPNDILWLYSRPLIVLIHLLGAAFAFLAPDDVLEKSALLRSFTDAVSSVLPFVSNFSGNSAFPQVSKAYVVLMLASSPYWYFEVARWPGLETNKQQVLAAVATSTGKKVLLLAFPVVMLLAMYVYFFRVEITDFHLAPFHRERWALALFGPIFCCWMVAFSFLVMIVPASVARRLWATH